MKIKKYKTRLHQSKIKYKKQVPKLERKIKYVNRIKNKLSLSSREAYLWKSKERI